MACRSGVALRSSHPPVAAAACRPSRSCGMHRLGGVLLGARHFEELPAAADPVGAGAESA